MNPISGEQIQEQARIISQVHKQLATSFHPALKNVAVAVAQYQKTQEANQKALKDYIATLSQLVDSAKDAEEPTRECVQPLKDILPIIKKFNDRQAPLITEFSEISRKIQANAEAEKENHRTALNSYLKKQRAIHKDVDKKRLTQNDLYAFYDKNKQEVIHLQRSRYNFFAERHVNLVKTLVEISMEANEDISRVLGMETKAEEEQRSRRSTAMRTGEPKSESVVSPNSVKDIPSGVPSPILPRSSEKVPIVSDRRDDVPDGTINQFLKELKEEEASKSHRSSFAQPPLPPNPRTTSTLPVDYFTPYTPPVDPRSSIYLPPTPPPERIPPPPIPREIESPVKPLPRPERHVPMKPAYLVSTNSPSSEKRYSGVERPTTILPNQTLPTQPVPVALPQKTEALMFPTSDYGSLLICTMPYTARTDRQLSLNVNDQVKLIRSGERGWVLVQTSAGQKVGWYPAKFVRKATPQEIPHERFE